jgi:hypothetical protein
MRFDNNFSNWQWSRKLMNIDPALHQTDSPLAGTFTGLVKQLQSFGRWSAFIEEASGVVVLGVGLYFL